MTLTLDAHAEELIQGEIDLGHYTNAAEVVTHALKLLGESEAWSPEEKAELDLRYDEGMAQIRRGEGIPGDQVHLALVDQRSASRLMAYELTRRALLDLDENLGPCRPEKSWYAAAEL